MAAAILVRRKAGASLVNLTDEDNVDTRPTYLTVFPSAASILKDLELGVLLGR